MLNIADTNTLMCDNASQCAQDMLKVGNICVRDPNEHPVGIVESTENEEASDALDAVKGETRSEVAKCTDKIIVS